MNNKRNWLVLVVVLIVVVGGYYIINNKKTAPGESFKIGAILPLTGDYASVAEEANKGALLAIDDAKAGGVKVDYVFENDEFKPTGFVNSAQKLLRENQIESAWTMIVTEVKPIAPIFNNAKVPLLAAWDSNDYIKSAGKYIFTIGFATEENGGKMAHYAFENLKLKHVAVLYQGEEWSELISSSFAKKFQELGGNVPVMEKFQLPDRDFRTVIAKIKNSGADGVYFPFNANANSYFLIQAKQLGLRIAFMTGDALIQDEIDAAGKSAEGTYFTNVYSENTDRLVGKYKEKFHTDPGSPTFVSFGYDAINILLEAHKIAVEKNMSARDALTMVKVEGTGSPIDMHGGQFSDRVERIYQIQNGKIVEVKK